MRRPTSEPRQGLGDRRGDMELDGVIGEPAYAQQHRDRGRLDDTIQAQTRTLTLGGRGGRRAARHDVVARSPPRDEDPPTLLECELTHHVPPPSNRCRVRPWDDATRRGVTRVREGRTRNLALLAAHLNDKFGRNEEHDGQTDHATQGAPRSWCVL